MLLVLLPTSVATLSFRFEVVVVSITTAVPEPIAPATRVVPEPSLQKFIASAVFRWQHAPATAARCIG